MHASRRTFRLFVLALIGCSLTACHFHRHGCRSFRFHAPCIRICR